MNYAPLAFLAAFFALSASWFGYVLTPQIQLGRELPGTNMANVSELYPATRPGTARQGQQVYRAEGCFYCHSQQVGQSATLAEVVLTEMGTNAAAVTKAFLAHSPEGTQMSPVMLAGGLPKTVMPGTNIPAADGLAKALKAAGAKAAIQFVPVGSDISRGWGRRRTVAADFLFDLPAMPGSQRVGPDLANAGSRLTDPNWHYINLYAPKAEVSGSIMPGYSHLFEEKPIAYGRPPSPDALKFPKDFSPQPPPGVEIVPKPEARELVAYLLSLHADAPLYEAPLTVAPPPAPATNSPAATTNAVAK